MVTKSSCDLRKEILKVTPLTRCFSQEKKSTASFPYRVICSDSLTATCLASLEAAAIQRGLAHTRNLDTLTRCFNKLFMSIVSIS